MEREIRYTTSGRLHFGWICHLVDDGDIQIKIEQTE